MNQNINAHPPSNKGKKHSLETIQKMRDTAKGRKNSEEAKIKMSESKKRLLRDRSWTHSAFNLKDPVCVWNNILEVYSCWLRENSQQRGLHKRVRKEFPLIKPYSITSSIHKFEKGYNPYEDELYIKEFHREFSLKNLGLKLNKKEIT